MTGFAAVLMITGTLGFFAYNRLVKIDATNKLIVNDALPGLYLITQIEGNAKENYISTLRHVAATNAGEKAKFDAAIQEASAQNSKNADDYAKSITRAKDAEIFEAIKTARGHYVAVCEEVLKFSREFKNKEAEAAVSSSLEPSFLRYMKALKDSVQFNKESGDQFSAEILGLVKSATSGIIGCLIAALGIGATIAFAVSRSIGKVLTSLSSALNDGSNQVAAASSQVSASSQSLAEGASEQAASLEETSASLEEMSSMTKRNSESAETAKDLATQTRVAADTGAADMQQMTSAMDAIKSSSNNIAKIIKTIDEIAFQTNILALNAAVEAARAGEAGMGFAVVADEVRNLAQRSAQAAKETAEKIEDSIRKSEQGVQISGKVALSLSEIVQKARKVDELVGEIAGASREQTQGIQQVNIAVTQMDKVTQANAANAEESASASEELNAQASTLKEAVQELVRLVGGSSNAQSASPVSRVEFAPSSKPAPFLSARKAPKIEPHLNGRGHAPKLVNGLAVPSLSSAGSRKESELPMAEDFKDF